MSLYKSKSNLNIEFQINKIAKEKFGVIATAEGSSVLATVEIQKRSYFYSYKPFFVQFFERFNAINKIPGGFKKRESTSDSEVILSRLIDRSIRPLIPKYFQDEIYLNVYSLSASNYSLEVLAVAAASLSMNLAGILTEPVSLLKINGSYDDYKLNSRNFDSDFKFFNTICNNKSIMVDFEGIDKSFQNRSESLVSYLYRLSFEHCNQMNSLQKKWLSKNKYQLLNDRNFEQPSYLQQIYINFWLSSRYLNALLSSDEKIIEEVNNYISEKEYGYYIYFNDMVRSRFSKYVLNNDKRLDDRTMSCLREIKFESNVTPSIQGSYLLTKGETQIYSSIAIDDSSKAQMIDNLDGCYKDPFIVHYNFWDSKKNYHNVSRREIGHGELIKKAFKGAIKSYKNNAIRVVCDVFACDGSSSMLSVCAASLLLKENQFIESNFAGVSIGVIKNASKNFLIADLSQLEDEYLSVVDCKVAGNFEEFSALQLDVKDSGLDERDFYDILAFARKKIDLILAKMDDCSQTKKNKQVKSFKDLKIESFGYKDQKENIKEKFQIQQESIRFVIGYKGTVIRNISETFNVKININDDGEILIISNNKSNNEAAKKYIQNLIDR